MDHYKILGVHKNASKEEIKQAFRKLAMEFHPDNHSQSSKNLRDSATQKFKQLTEAYDTLTDDRKRADYNLRRNAYGPHHQSSRHDYKYGGGGGANSYSNAHGYGYGYSGAAARSGGDGVFAKFEMGLRFLTTRSFLLNATFFGPMKVLKNNRVQSVNDSFDIGRGMIYRRACILLGGMFIVDSSGKALWKMQNNGKSFEDAMESIEKAKADKDSSY